MTEEERRKARGKEIHRRVMIVLGALIAASGLAAWRVGSGGAAFLQPVMFGRFFERASPKAPPLRRPAPMLARWRALDARSLSDARAQGKLVLASVVAPWSGPCRRMDEGAYADPAVAVFLSSEVVAARVDAEGRPDLALRYLGRGWPTTALLLPSGRLLEAGTYMDSPLLLSWARAVIADYGKRRGVLDAALAGAAAPAEPAPLSADSARLLALARDGLAAARNQPVFFPRFDGLDELLEGVDKPWVREECRKTLESSGRLEDPVWGGFYRDARSGDLAEVEREKLLADQAAAVGVLARLTRVAQARRTLSYVERFLEDPKGGYYSSQAGEADRPDGTVESGDSYFAKADGARLQAGLPRVDRRLFAAENAAMARAALSAGSVARPRDRAFALKTLERWWRSGVRGGIVCRELDARSPCGLLEDQVELARAYAAAYAATRDPKQLQRAGALLSACERRLVDGKSGALYDRAATGELSPDLDRLLVARLEFKAWRAYGEAAALEKDGPRRARWARRAEALRAWLWAHRARLDPSALAVVASSNL